MSFIAQTSTPLVDIPLYVAARLQGAPPMRLHPDCSSAHQGAKDLTPKINTFLGYAAIGLGVVVVISLVAWGASSDNQHLRRAGIAIGSLLLLGGLLWTFLDSFGITTCL